MRIFKIIYTAIFFTLIFLLIKPPFSYANCCTLTHSPNPLYANSKEGKIDFTISSDKPGTFLNNFSGYAMGMWPPGEEGSYDSATLPITVKNDKTITSSFFFNPYPVAGDFLLKPGSWQIKLWAGNPEVSPNALVYSGTFTVGGPRNPNGTEPLLSITSPIQITKTATLTITNIDTTQNYAIYFDDNKEIVFNDKFSEEKAILHINVGGQAKNRTICMRIGKITSDIWDFICEYRVTIDIVSTPPTNTTVNTSRPFSSSASLPSYLTSDDTNTFKNVNCAEGYLIDGECKAVDTAIGIVETDPAKFVQRIFSMVLGMAGGIALVLIIVSGYKFMASRGNPEALKGATEQLTSAIIGLLFIIFSFVILQIVGVDILRIPGFK